MNNLARGGSPGRRCHGSLDSVTDSERRNLRPIGATAYEAALLTNHLLAGLVEDSGVHLFQGIRAMNVDAPSIPHAVSAGCGLVFVESVTWPSGHYGLAAAGQVLCDNVYIGQSVGSLVEAVRRWRKILPTDHRVTALVVVHPCRGGPVTLPQESPDELRWALPDRVVADLSAMLPARRGSVSRAVIDALTAAIEC